jgi:hypothetical protein
MAWMCMWQGKRWETSFCMCYYHWCSLHHIYVSWISNNDIHQGSRVISGDKDIHSSLVVAREKMKDLYLNMCSILQNNSWNNILKHVVGYYMINPARASKQMGTQIVNGMATLTLWKMGYHRMWQAKMCM